MVLHSVFCFTLLFVMCCRMCDLGGVLRWDFKHGLGLLFTQFDMHCFCGSIALTAFVCCVVSFVALGA